MQPILRKLFKARASAVKSVHRWSHLWGFVALKKNLSRDCESQSRRVIFAEILLLATAHAVEAK